MSVIAPIGATIPEVTHHLTDLNGSRIHYVSAGDAGSPILLVHGWPETWWAFRSLIPILATTHRVFALDIRGFGDSDAAASTFGEADAAADLHRLVEHLALGPVHLLAQDISGGLAFRFAATHPDLVASFTAVESSLVGFGLEALADVNSFGSWHVGFLGTRGIASMLLPGHERELLAGWAFPLMNGTAGAVLDSDLDEFERTYSRPDAWRGTEGIYSAIFSDKETTKQLAEEKPLRMPVLAVDGANAPFTELSFRPVAADRFTAVRVEGVGHLVAQEAPEQLASALLEFIAGAES